MKTVTRLAVTGTFALLLAACSSIPVTRVSVQSFELQKPGITPSVAISKLTSVLVDRGFDVKMSNVESGIVTTEYKKFASVSTKPPFDYYMQIRAKVKVGGRATSIQLTPIVKEQNRLNVAAFNEQELVYFSGEPANVQEIESMNAESGWRTMGQILFMNIVTDSADAFGVGTEQIVQNVSKSAANARDAN